MIVGRRHSGLNIYLDTIRHSTLQTDHPECVTITTLRTED